MTTRPKTKKSPSRSAKATTSKKTRSTGKARKVVSKGASSKAKTKTKAFTTLLGETVTKTTEFSPHDVHYRDFVIAKLAISKPLEYSIFFATYDFAEYGYDHERGRGALITGKIVRKNLIGWQHPNGLADVENGNSDMNDEELIAAMETPEQGPARLSDTVDQIIFFVTEAEVNEWLKTQTVEL